MPKQTPYRMTSSGAQAASCSPNQESRSLEDALKRSQEFLLSLQYDEGNWWAELESNVTLTAESVLLYKILGVGEEYPLSKMERFLRSRQCEHGGWEICYGDGGNLSMTVEAYMALRLLHVPANDPALLRAREFILSKGGASNVRIFTQLCLAIMGCYSWDLLPSLPPWLLLLPNWFFVNIYELSSWARSAVIPLVVVFGKKPVFPIGLNLDELFIHDKVATCTGLRSLVARFKKMSWFDLFFYGVDRALKFTERHNLVPFRELGLREATKWTLERQEESGDWAGIFPPMFFSMLCCLLAGYTVSDPVIHKGLEAIKGFSIETESEYWVTACVSPVWDTALVVRALGESGLDPSHPALQKAGRWMMERQIMHLGDWIFKNQAGVVDAGGWAFEFFNKWYPDVDDTAVVVMALNALQFPDEQTERRKQAAMARAVRWVASMQCKAGGWAAFDKDNDQEWLNSTPFADLKGMNDPNTADVSARVIEMVGNLKYYKKGGGLLVCDEEKPDDEQQGQQDLWLPSAACIGKGLAFLRREQEKEGCWYGRWGVNYIYGTCGALVALALVAPTAHQEVIERGARWLVQVQNSTRNSKSEYPADGGWGETCASYADPGLKGQGESTASQTAWALMGLLAAGDALGKYEVEAIEDGVDYLLRSQAQDGSWHEALFTGTGFPNHFYLRYHLYCQHFTLTALARYRSRLLHMKIMSRTRPPLANNPLLPVA